MLCESRKQKFGSSYSFPLIDCVNRDCEHCGVFKLWQVIEEANAELLKLNKRISWHKWQVVPGHSTAPQKCEIKNTLKMAVNEFLEIIEDISDHLFHANWHQNVFQYIKGHLLDAYVLQVMDFAMNFNNQYQDKVQSAYWNGTQTTIHATVNFLSVEIIAMK